MSISENKSYVCDEKIVNSIERKHLVRSSILILFFYFSGAKIIGNIKLPFIEIEIETPDKFKITLALIVYIIYLMARYYQVFKDYFIEERNESFYRSVLENSIVIKLYVARKIKNADFDKINIASEQFNEIYIYIKNIGEDSKFVKANMRNHPFLILRQWKWMTLEDHFVFSYFLPIALGFYALVVLTFSLNP